MEIYTWEGVKKLNTKKYNRSVKSEKMDNKTNSNYNKIEYCLGNSLELLSAPTVFAVYAKILVFFEHGNYLCLSRQLLKVNCVIVFPRMVGNVRACRIVFKILLMFFSSGFKASVSFSYITPTAVRAQNFVNNIAL